MKSEEEFELSLTFASGAGMDGITAAQTTVGEFDGGVELYEYISEAIPDENGVSQFGEPELVDFFTLTDEEAKKLYEWLRSWVDRQKETEG